MAADEAPASRGSSPFTALELAAAEQLIHLSESSCSSGAALTPRGAGRGLLRLPLPASAASAASSSTASPRSVNNAPAPAPAPVPVAAAEDDGDEEEEDDDEQEVGGRRRRNKRYRPIAEIYAAAMEEPKPIGPRRRRAADRPRATDGAAKARK